MALQLKETVVDMTPEVWTYEKDAEVRITGAPITPGMQEQARRKADVQITTSRRGDGDEDTRQTWMRTSDLQRVASELAILCFRSWEGIDGACTAHNIRILVQLHGDVVSDACDHFKELYDSRKSAAGAARADAEGNSRGLLDGSSSSESTAPVSLATDPTE
jgi:hypothetical protein